VHCASVAACVLVTRVTLEGTAVNIAVIKYWGKRNVERILPTNSSLSVTISQDHLSAKTTARADAAFAADTLWLNGVEEAIGETGRMAACLRELRKERRLLEKSQSGDAKVMCVV
jgi:diphosphomevalonate decarboxylase